MDSQTLNKSELYDLQRIVMGVCYIESLIIKALAAADSLEETILLKALKRGPISFRARMTLQSYIAKSLGDLT